LFASTAVEAAAIDFHMQGRRYAWHNSASCGSRCVPYAAALPYDHSMTHQLVLMPQDEVWQDDHGRFLFWVLY
jgi:hypothetical protein